MLILQPKILSHKKNFYPKMVRIKKMSDNLLFGEYGLKILENHCFKASQLESLKKNLFKNLKKIGKLWIRPFPHFFLTKKPAEVRMGNGKGNFDCWVVNLPSGYIIIEFTIFNKEHNLNIMSIFKNLKSKLGIKCKLLIKNDLL